MGPRTTATTVGLLPLAAIPPQTSRDLLDDHFIAVLLDELPPPALPAPRLVPDRRLRCLQAVRRGKCKHRQGEEHVHLDGAFGLLGGMLQVPRLLTFLDAAVLDETPIVVGVEGG